MSNRDINDERSPEDTSAEEYLATGDVESEETGTDYNPTTGEPDATPHDRVLEAEDIEAGNPNAATSGGLEGDMGISSERTGPADETGTGGLGDLGGFEGTGTVGSARGRTHGSVPTTGGPDLPESDESENPAEVPSHELGNKNPGHSGA
ncbi:MAG TPA: hypothetical protein VLB29_16460 [Nocardioidaceae bacterium]|nr:hypothetical protein [Nocardioidaceae bacterium]